jgi:hypothetical protein
MIVKNLYENLSAVSDFLKSKYNNIFQEPNQALNNLFVDFTKKFEVEKNVSDLYMRYIRSNQTTLQNEINKCETIDEINKLLSDEIKYFYFSLKPVVNKLQNPEFTIEKIFEKSRDKNLRALMSYPEDKFSNAVGQYVSQYVVSEIKKDAGMVEQTVSEQIKMNIYRILELNEEPQQTTELNQDEQLLSYKKSTAKWFNLSLFQLLKNKQQVLNQNTSNSNNSVDVLSKQMKSTDNDNAKKTILNRIINMNKEELQNLANSLGLTEEEIGKL